MAGSSQKILHFYRIQMSILVFSKCRHCSLTSTNSMQFTPLDSTPFMYILIYHINCSCFQCGRSPNIIIEVFLIYITCNTGIPARVILFVFNLLKPTGPVMHRQFNIQQLYVLPTLYLCGLYLSQNKQRLVPLTA